MSTHYIRAPGQDFVVVVPRATARDASLSYRARGVLARLLSNAEGYSMSAVDLAKEGREGRDAIRAALRELRGAGYIIQHATTNAAGQFTGTEAYVFATPQVENREPENPLAGNPPAGMAPLKSSKSITNLRKRSSTAGVRAAALSNGSGRALPVAASAANAMGVGESTTVRRRRRTDAETGIVYWLADEPSEIARLIETFGLEAVKAEASRLRDAGMEPLPSIVSKRLVSMRRGEVEAQTQLERRRGPTAEQRAADARKAKAELAEYAAHAGAPTPPRQRDPRTIEQILADWVRPRVGG